MKKNSVLVMLLIVLMCVSLVITGCQKAGDDGDKGTTAASGETGGEMGPENGGNTFEDPNDQVANAIGKTMAALIDTDAIGSLLAEVVNGGKITVEAADMIENVLYMDVLGNRYADILTINVREEIEVGVYLDENQLVVSAPALLGDEAYGIDFDTLETDLENCELWALMGTTYEEFQSQAGINLDAAFDALEKYMDAVSNMGSSMEESLKDVEVTREEATVTINGETVNAVNVKYHLTSDDVQSFMSAYLDEMENSMDAMKESFADVLTGVDMDEIMGDMDIDTMRQEMDDVFATLELEGDLVVSINPDTQYIMSVSIDIAGTADGEEGKIDMDLVLGVDPTNSDKYSFTMFVEADGERSGITADVVFASEGSVDTTTLTINEIYNDETTTVATAELTYDSSNGEYKLVLTDEWETISIDGVYLVTADKLEFSVETVTDAYEGEEYTETIGLRLCIESIDKSEIPDMPSMKNVLKLTQDEWTDLLSKFQTAEPDDYYDEDIYYGENGYYGDYTG